MFVFITTCLLLLAAKANVGPKTTVSLIPRTQDVDNPMGKPKGNSLEMTYWVYTYDHPDEDDVGVAEINFDTTLILNGVQDFSEIYWCALITKRAGTKTNYDCGLCFHSLNKTLHGKENPTDVELDHRKASWQIRDSWFPDQQPYRPDPQAYEIIKNGLDSTYEDYSWRDEMTFQAEIVPNTEIVRLACPVKRLMNTQDYDDAKVEIYLKYDIKGFYIVVGPQPQDGSDRTFVYAQGEVVEITIQDESLMGLTTWLPLLALVGALLFV